MASPGLDIGVRTSDELHNVTIIVGLTTTLVILCVLLYSLRLLSRKLLRTALWVDDYWMLLALFVCCGMSILNYVGVAYGSGVHRSHLELSEYRSFQINLYVFMMFWALGVLVVKIGILLFYWRIFSVAEFRRRVFYIGCVLAAAHSAIFLVFMFQCTPIPRFWADTDTGYCIHQVPFYITGGSLNILGDVVVLSLPIHQVWKLRTSRNSKLALMFLFGLGGFVCITSVLRLIALNEIDPEDFSYTNVGGGLWSTAEVQVGFICANLPHTRPLAIWLIRKIRGQSTTVASTGPSSSGGNMRSYGRGRSNRNTRVLKSYEMENIKEPTSMVHVVDGGGDGGRGSTSEEASVKTYGSDRELKRDAAPWGQDGQGIAVKTEMTQEIGHARSEPPAGSNISMPWDGKQVSTNITASGAKH